MFKNPRSYILAGVIILLATWFWQFLKIEYYRSQEFYIATVELGIEEQLANVELEMIPVLDSVSTVDILEFSDYSFKTTYPFLIYRNGELKVWKDYHLAPTFTEINSEENVFLLRNSGGDFLVRKWHSDSRSGQYLIASLIPLTIEYKVQNSYLSDYFNESIFKDLEVQISNQEVAEYLPVKVRGESLLWIMVNSAEGLEKSPYLISLLTLYTIGIFLLIIGSAIWAIGTSDGRQWMLIVYIIAVWGILKLAVFLTGFPDSLVTIDLFDSKFFVVSWFEQSFGDMLLNTIAILLIGIILFRHYRQPFANLNLSGRAKLLLAVGLSFVLHLVINYQYLQLRTIYFNSQLSLDITSSFHFDSFRIYALIVFVIVGISSALLFHVVFKHLEALLKGTGQKVLTLLAGTLIFVLFTIPANLPLANLVLVTLTLSILLFASGIHRALQQARLSATLYLLLWILIEAGIGGWCVMEFEKTRQVNKMVRFAQNLASKNDYMAEFMIAEVIESVQNDPSISARLSNPFLSKEYIINKITRGYFSKYLDKYASAVYLYSHSGEGIPGFGTNQNYQSIYQRYALERNKTEYADLFVLSQDVRTLTKHYMAFIPIQRYQSIIGYIILDLRQRRLAPESVYPELLVDNRFSIYQNNDFSYAIFESDYLIHSSGDIDYRYVDIELGKEKNLWSGNGYLHYLLNDGHGDHVIVSSVYSPVWSAISNTSFFVIALLVPTIVILSIILLMSINSGREISYTAKIQVFLNLAFFLPLVLVTITTLSFITSSFKDELIDTRISESSRLASQIESETDAFIVDVTAKDVLTDKLEQLSRYGNFDATVFGTDGKMITTTQPGIYSNNLQSGYLNHQAVTRIIEGEEASVVLDESIGSLNYYTTYSAIRSPETNRLLGVLGVPFFSAQSTIEANQIEALNTILNVFVLIFMLAILGTFQTSRWLTAPLQLIRKRLGMTSFSGENTPIEWHSDDEIGNLIGEYNNMLIKLEESREALKRSQKESAWREVAQQVAHEIKNPLTPMKLTLQKLEMAVKSDKPRENIEKTVNNLLNQLQMLNDIVTSFSEFAKMPIPKNERINLIEIVKEVEMLFRNQDHIDLELQTHTAEVLIMADEKLMNRILSNIIINAGQSIRPDQEKVKVKINTEFNTEGTTVQIKISDNGTGIDKDVVDRVFIPKFSTKEEGSGIGLAVAKHGVENSGGAIWFETQPGEGTSFYIKLPIVA
jgi:two-component system nitrogen regulation sensor histidine kinase NtrY